MKHWNEESFGSECPINWEEIADAANNAMDAFAEGHDEDETEIYCDHLWEDFCENDAVCGIAAEWLSQQES